MRRARLTWLAVLTLLLLAGLFGAATYWCMSGRADAITPSYWTRRGPGR